MKRIMSPRTSLLASLVASQAMLGTIGTIGCGTDIDKPDGGPMVDEGLTTTDNGDGTFTAEIDATSETDWIYMNIQTGKQVMPETPESSPDWDIAFQRFKVKTNSGISGSGDACAYRLPNTTFDEVTGIPAGDCLVDEADGDDVGEIDDFAVSSLGDRNDTETGPWGYNPIEHEVLPIDDSFVVKVNGGDAHYKLSFLEYYNEGGDAGFIVMRYAPVTGMQEPPHPNELTLTGPLREEVYLKLGTGVVDAPGEPNSSLDWDLKVLQTGWSTNGGTSEELMQSRTGTAAVAVLPPGTVFDEVTASDVQGLEYSMDETLMFPGPPGSPQFLGNPNMLMWFNYDSSTHTVTSTGDVYAIRGADGQTFGILQIVSYKEDLEADPSTMTYKILLKAFD